jgi:hypothetical protein
MQSELITVIEKLSKNCEKFTQKPLDKGKLSLYNITRYIEIVLDMSR